MIQCFTRFDKLFLVAKHFFQHWCRLNKAVSWHFLTTMLTHFICYSSGLLRNITCLPPSPSFPFLPPCLLDTNENDLKNTMSGTLIPGLQEYSKTWALEYWILLNSTKVKWPHLNLVKSSSIFFWDMNSSRSKEPKLKRNFSVLLYYVTSKCCLHIYIELYVLGP